MASSSDEVESLNDELSQMTLQSETTCEEFCQGGFKLSIDDFIGVPSSNDDNISDDEEEFVIYPNEEVYFPIEESQNVVEQRITFAISVLKKICPKVPICQAVVLLPQRALANLVYGYISSMGQSIGITSALIMGGTNEDRNRNELEEMVQVVVGTIGCIRAMIYEGCIPRRCIRFLILDEAHQMLSNRIKDQTYEITQAMPFSTQIIAISAAKKARILEYRKKFARNPFLVIAKAPELSIQGMYQFYMLIQGEGMKQQTLLDIYENISRRKTIVFCNTKSTVEQLASELSKKNYNALAIHDETNCEQKQHILDEFRKADGNSRCLITTNLLANFRDVQSVSIIVNYDLPTNPEDYVHRIGHWINFGRKGVAINFVSQAEKSILKDIESFHNTKILEMPEKMVESLKKKPAQ